MGAAGPQETPRPDSMAPTAECLPALCSALCVRFSFDPYSKLGGRLGFRPPPGSRGPAPSAPPFSARPHVLHFHCPVAGLHPHRLIHLIPTLIPSGLCLCCRLCLEPLPTLQSHPMSQFECHFLTQASGTALSKQPSALRPSLSCLPIDFLSQRLSPSDYFVCLVARCLSPLSRKVKFHRKSYPPSCPQPL